MNLLIKNFPNDLHKALKIKAINNETSLTKLIIKLLQEATKHDNRKK